jgi:hypothetical protein
VFQQKNDDDEQFNLSHDHETFNISETNDSMLEKKNKTTVPVLKNIDKLKSKITKENNVLFGKAN